MSSLTGSPVRVPAGSLIAVGPPGSGKTTVLRAKLEAAGLATNRTVNRDDLRAKLAGSCSMLPCRAVPASCHHHEKAVTAVVDAHASTFLAAGQSWMYDATNTNVDDLREQVDRAHRAGMAAVALRRSGYTGQEFISLAQCLLWNRNRARRVPEAAMVRIHAQYAQLTHAALKEIGFDVVIDWNQDTTFELMPQSADGRGISTTEMVVVGDLHGCARTFLDRLLPSVGTDVDLSNPNVVIVSVGDIHDKGADPQGSVELIRWWLRAIRTGRALMTDSNHNRKLVRHLTGHEVRIGPGLADTLAAIDAQPDAEALKADIVATFSRLPSHLWFDDLVVVHAGITEAMLGATSARAHGFMLYSRNARTPWEWTGSQTLVHGHEPVVTADRRQAAPDPTRPGHTPGPVLNIDTGAYTGGLMTAYVHATGAIVSVETLASEALTPTRVAHAVPDLAEDDNDIAA